MILPSEIQITWISQQKQYNTLVNCIYVTTCNGTICLQNLISFTLLHLHLQSTNSISIRSLLKISCILPMVVMQLVYIKYIKCVSARLIFWPTEFGQVTAMALTVTHSALTRYFFFTVSYNFNGKTVHLICISWSDITVHSSKSSPRVLLNYGLWGSPITWFLAFYLAPLSGFWQQKCWKC